MSFSLPFLHLCIICCLRCCLFHKISVAFRLKSINAPINHKIFVTNTNMIHYSLPFSQCVAIKALLLPPGLCSSILFMTVEKQDQGGYASFLIFLVWWKHPFCCRENLLSQHQHKNQLRFVFILTWKQKNREGRSTSQRFKAWKRRFLDLLFNVAGLQLKSYTEQTKYKEEFSVNSVNDFNCVLLHFHLESTMLTCPFKCTISSLFQHESD